VIGHGRVTVGTSATKLTTADSGRQSGSRLHVRNPSATVSVFLGGSAVTAGTGYELPPGASVAITLDADEEVFAAVAVGTLDVHVLRGGV
jgi:hypothetical protein